jgi:hypothetical protein
MLFVFCLLEEYQSKKLQKRRWKDILDVTFRTRGSKMKILNFIQQTFLFSFVKHQEEEWFCIIINN